MDLPVDPTTAGADPKAIIRTRPNQAALRRALDTASVHISASDVDDIDKFVDDLDPVQSRTLASQIQLAAPRTIFYYRIPGLATLIDTLSEEANNMGSRPFGPETRSIIHDHDRVYVVCSVPPGGTQAQISPDESSRETAIATFDPGSELLAVRASSAETADSARSAVVSQFNIGHGERLSSTVLRDQFGAERINAYTKMTFQGSQGIATDRIEVSAGPRTNGVEDLRRDDVVTSLLSHPEIELAEAQVVIELDESFSIGISYVESRIDIQQFRPEETLIELDRAVARAVEQ